MLEFDLGDSVKFTNNSKRGFIFGTQMEQEYIYWFTSSDKIREADYKLNYIGYISSLMDCGNDFNLRHCRLILIEKELGFTENEDY